MVVGSANRSDVSGGVAGQERPQTLFQQIADVSNIPFIGPMIQNGGQAFIASALISVGTALILVIGILWVMRIVRARYKQDTVEKIDERKEDE
jgi:hypothetical protein